MLGKDGFGTAWLGGCWDVGRQGTRMQGYGEARMQRCWDGGRHGDARYWGCRIGGVQHVGSPQGAGRWKYMKMEVYRVWGRGCRPVRCHGGTSGAPHLLCSPKHTGETSDGKVGHVVGWLLTQAQLTQQLAHHWCQLEPMACGKEREGGDTTIPTTPDSSGVQDCGVGCPPLPEKPAPMTMLLNLGCRSRMKSSSGVFWGARV